MKFDPLNDTKALAILAGLAVAGYLVYRILKTGPGLLSGNNALTQNATDASGAPTTAYVGQGVTGTLGAAANAASGGYLASFGDWIGGKAADMFQDDPNADANAQLAASQAAYSQPIAAHDQQITGTFDPGAFDSGTGAGW